MTVTRPMYRPRGVRISYELPVEQAVYVPSTTKNNKKIGNLAFKRRIELVRRALSNKYGGYTSVDAVGGYVDKKNLIKEKVVKVTSFANQKDYRKHKRYLWSQLGNWQKRWHQDSIGYEVEGDMYYVKSRKLNKSKKRVQGKKNIWDIRWL